MSTSWKMAALLGLTVCLWGAPVSAQPANDECTGAIAVGEGIATGDNTGSVVDGPTDGDGNMGDDIWFLYTPSSAGVVTVETCGTTGPVTDTVLIVYDAALGCPTAGSPFVASEDDSCTAAGGGSAFASGVSFPVSGTDSYYVQVGDFNGGTQGVIDVNITLTPIAAEICDDGIDNDADGDTDCDDADCAADAACLPPMNDNCADAIALADGVATAFSTSNATDEGTFSCRGSSDVWFEYTAAATGTLDVVLSNTADLGGGFWDTNHSVYLNSTPGSCPTDADEQACSDPTSITGLPVIGGQSYLIRVGTWSSTSGEQGTGDVTATLTAATPEVCDDGVDNDADGDTDCADSDCAAEAACIEAGNCGDGIDNDLDGLTDCADVADCGAEPSCAAPANDDCVNAQAIGEGSFPFDNTNALLDGPTDADGNMDADVWFLYTATAGGTATIDTCAGPAGSLTDTVIIVYDGAMCPIAGDPAIASDDDTCAAGGAGSAFASEVQVPVCAGDTLLIQVGGWNGAEGDAILSVNVAAPSNDDCTAATPVGEGSFDFSNCGATLDGPTDADGNMDLDVWFLYTAGGDGNAVIETCGTTGALDDTVIIVYDGAACPVAGDVGLASDDDTPGCGPSGFNSSVSIPVTTGQTLLIQVGGWNGAEGDGTLSISLPEVCNDGIDNDADGDTDCADADCVANAVCIEAGNCADGIDNDLDGLTDCDDVMDCGADVLCDGLPPANDDCANAEAVGEGSFVVDNQDAVLDGPTDADGNMDTDVWYLYTASVSGTATISNCGDGPGSLTDTVMIIYDGTMCPIAGDPFIASADDTCSLGGGSAFAAEIEIPVVAGDTYLIQVGGWNGATGVGELNIDVVIPGDNCTDPFMVGEGSFDFDNTGATLDGPIDGDANMTNDVWFLYTATTPGDATFTTCNTMGTLTDTVMIIYDATTGCPVAGDAGLASDDDTCGPTGFNAEITLPVMAGEQYYVQVGGWNGTEGDGTLDISVVLPCVDPTPSFSAGPALSGIAPLSVDFMNTSDNGGDAATTYDWTFGDGGTSGDENPSYTYTGCGTFDVTLTANGCGVSVPTTQAGLITVYAMGDTNGDCNVDVADAIATANYLFAGGPAPVCGNASDVNGDGTVDIADAVYMLIFLFGGGSAPVAPAGSGC